MVCNISGRDCLRGLHVLTAGLLIAIIDVAKLTTNSGITLFGLKLFLERHGVRQVKAELAVASLGAVGSAWMTSRAQLFKLTLGLSQLFRLRVVTVTESDIRHKGLALGTKVLGAFATLFAGLSAVLAVALIYRTLLARYHETVDEQAHADNPLAVTSIQWIAALSASLCYLYFNIPSAVRASQTLLDSSWRSRLSNGMASKHGLKVAAACSGIILGLLSYSWYMFEATHQALSAVPSAYSGSFAKAFDLEPVESLPTSLVTGLSFLSALATFITFALTRGISSLDYLFTKPEAGKDEVQRSFVQTLAFRRGNNPILFSLDRLLATLDLSSFILGYYITGVKSMERIEVKGEVLPQGLIHPLAAVGALSTALMHFVFVVLPVWNRDSASGRVEEARASLLGGGAAGDAETGNKSSKVSSYGATS